MLPPGGTPTADLGAHLRQHGPPPDLSASGGLAALIGELGAAGLTGRGGARFPAHRKLAAVAGAAAPGAAPVVVGNAAEGEPASAKDRTLLRLAPHLVLDGLTLVAGALGADAVFLCLRPGSGLDTDLAAMARARAAAGIDRVPTALVTTPPRFLSGQESALVNVINGGPALPTYTPPRVFERGVGGRPTYLSNVETLAHLALIARRGAAWFRTAGTPSEPGTMLCTLWDTGGQTTVAEPPLGVRLADLTDLRTAQAVLIGGYHGVWLPAADAALMRLSAASLRSAGAVPGAEVIAALPRGRCGLAEIQPSPAGVRVLVVDDEPSLAELLSSVLRYEGWAVRTAGDGASAVRIAREFQPAAVILDVMLPDSDGFDVMRRLRADQPGICVLFLTARDAVEDRVAGITAGGDDYVTKPFSLEEVLARLGGMLRRAGVTRAQGSPALTVADLELDEDSREVRRGGRLIELTTTEFELLRYLMHNPRRVLSKAQILDRVWDYDFGGQAHVVELYISYLRKKIDAGREPLIHTIRGVGYVLRPTG